MVVVDELLYKSCVLRGESLHDCALVLTGPVEAYSCHPSCLPPSHLYYGYTPFLSSWPDSGSIQFGTARG